MNTNYLRAFVIGSSFLVVLPHLFAVSRLDESKLNYTYKQYSFVVPMYYGLMNALSLYIALTFDLTNTIRYLLIGSISPLLVISFSYFMKTYRYEGSEWATYGIGLFLKHFLIWNLVVQFLDKFV